MDDDMLLQAIIGLEDGQILNLMQAAAELEGTLFDRLSKAYFEVTNRDDGGDTMIGLKE